MTNDIILSSLRNTAIPAVDPDKKARAIAAATMAFEANAKKVQVLAKGNAAPQRRTSVIQSWMGTIMDKRWLYGVSTAAICIIAAPIAWQQYSTSSQQELTRAIDEAASPMPQTETAMSEEMASGLAQQTPPRDASVSSQMDMELSVADSSRPQSSNAAAPAIQSVQPTAPRTMPAAPPMAQTGVAKSSPGMAAMEAPAMATRMIAPAPYPMVVPPMPSGDAFPQFEESQIKSVATDPVSTFSVDVDTASYAFVRSMLRDGIVPPADAVRIEEMVNYFPYDYAPPPSDDAPFAVRSTVVPSPWADGKQILHMSIKGYEPPADERKSVSLTFLIDTSGSMNDPSKLPLLKRSLALLLDTLDERDTISIVTYAGSAGVVLGPTQADRKATILEALDRLDAGGGTAGSEGLMLAYRVAEDSTIEGGINRVLLATDGDFNLGISDPEQLEDFIAKRRDMGISLSVLGFGMGNYGDDTMQALAQNGNGNASYISDFAEARKVLVEEVGGTLETIAKDVKIQIEFNPSVVSEYRLIGYETRALANQDFNNDKVDAGDIGAGHTVTALYEITPVGSEAAALEPLRYGDAKPTPALTSKAEEIAFVKLRYKLPDESTSKLIENPIRVGEALDDVASASDDVRFSLAVAAFAQKLKGSIQMDMGWPAIRTLAAAARGEDEAGYRSEFLRVIDDAAALKR